MSELRDIFRKYKAVVFFDTETTGLDAETCQIIELAAIRIEQGSDGLLRVAASVDMFVKLPEGQKFPEQITELTGITDAIPLVDDKGQPIDTIAKAIKWKTDHGYTSEFSKVYWPKVKDGSGRVFHLSTAGQATMLRVDLSHDGVPFESPSNKEIMATAQFFGEGSKNKGFDQQTGNGLNEEGITTAVFWAGQWVLWGPHTAAFIYNGSMDARAIFDVNLRMLMYITNSFQLDHGTEIDSPMTPQDKDTILNFEKAKLDTLTGIGALIGTPSVEFLETENSTSDMMNGDFVWHFAVTNTPPFKSGTARVTYTDEGFAAFFETE